MHSLHALCPLYNTCVSPANALPNALPHAQVPPRGLELLKCPVCARTTTFDSPLTITGTALTCPQRHTFNIARQGYLSLLSGPAPTSADSPDMVRARDSFLTSGAYAPLRDALSHTVAEVCLTHAHTCILDAGCGTGYYLGAVLEALHATGVAATGLGFDTAALAVRLTRRAHPAITAFTWDVFKDFPVRTGAIDVVLDVFSPRNADEFNRVLRPGGHVVVVTPTQAHLQQLRASTNDMVGIAPRKDERLAASMHRFSHVSTTPVTFSAHLTEAQARDLISMTPLARHVDAGQISQLPDEVTVAVKISVWRKRD